jgi:hypothetical protein
MLRRRILIVQEIDDTGKVTHHPLRVPHLPKYLPLDTIIEQLERFIYALRRPAAVEAREVRIIREHDPGVEPGHSGFESNLEESITLQLAEAAERGATHSEQTDSDVTTSFTDAGDVVAPDPRSEESPVQPDPSLPQSSPEVQESTDVQLLVRRKALTRAERHAAEDTSKETGGVLLGAFVPREGGTLVLVAGIARALTAVRGAASLNFTPEAWADIWSRIDGHPDYQDDEKWRVVGWYHTHPRYGVFLSSMDLFIHNRYFTHPGHVALVIDPVHSTRGFFCWDARQDKVVECSGRQLCVVNEEGFAQYLEGIKVSMPAPEIIQGPAEAAQKRREEVGREYPMDAADAHGGRDGRER